VRALFIISRLREGILSFGCALTLDESSDTSPGIALRTWRESEPQLPPMIDLILEARVSIAKGLVSMCMPGSRWPLPSAAFSA
jgi:hypothetical protein